MKRLREIVPLSEISKKTLSSYVKKAVYNSGNASFRHGQLYGKELATKKRTYDDKIEGHKLNSTISKRETGIDNALHRLTGRFNVALKKDPKKFAGDGEYLGPLTQSKKYKLKEDREAHIKKHGDAMCCYADKIKKCCEEFTKLCGKYDDYELKSLARELEDIYERIDNQVSSKKESKKAQDTPKVNPVYEENLAEISKKTLMSYYKKANDERLDKPSRNPEGFHHHRLSGLMKANNRLHGNMYTKHKGNIDYKANEEVVGEGKFSELDIQRQEKEAQQNKINKLKLAIADRKMGAKKKDK